MAGAPTRTYQRIVPREPSERDQRLRDELARNLHAALLKKGWTQSELALRCGNWGRDTISKYARARFFPEPHRLERLAKVLGMTVEELVPGLTNHGEDIGPALEMRQVEGKPDRVLLRINQELPLLVAVEVMKLISAKA